MRTDSEDAGDVALPVSERVCAVIPVSAVFLWKRKGALSGVSDATINEMAVKGHKHEVIHRKGNRFVAEGY